MKTNLNNQIQGILLGCLSLIVSCENTELANTVSEPFYTYPLGTELNFAEVTMPCTMQITSSLGTDSSGVNSFNLEYHYDDMGRLSSYDDYELFYNEHGLINKIHCEEGWVSSDEYYFYDSNDRLDSMYFIKTYDDGTTYSHTASAKLIYNENLIDMSVELKNEKNITVNVSYQFNPTFDQCDITYINPLDGKTINVEVAFDNKGKVLPYFRPLPLRGANFYDHYNWPYQMILGQSNITSVKSVWIDDDGIEQSWLVVHEYEYNEYDYPIERKSYTNDIYVMTDVFSYSCIE